MTNRGEAYIAGAFEHPTRKATDKSLAQLHAEVAKGALEDAGLSKDDVDGYFCAGDAPGLGPLSMIDYMGLNPRHMDSSETGGSSYVLHVGHAAAAIAAGTARSELFDALKSIDGIEPYPSAANFILLRVPTGQATSIFESLKAQNVLIKNMHPAGGMLADCLRVTVSTPEENAAFLSALRASLA